MPQYSLKYRIESKYHKWMWWLFITVVYIKIPQYYHHCLMAECRISRCNKIILTWICYCTTLKHCVCESQRCWMDGGGWRNQGQKTGSGLRPFMWRAEGWVGVGVSWGNEGGFECISRPCFHVRSAEPVPHQTHPNDGFKNKSSSTVIIHYLFLHMCVCVCVCVCMQHLRGRKSIRAPWQIRGWCRVARVTVFALL